VAQELTLVIKGGDSERLGAMLGSDPGLATCLVMEDGAVARRSISSPTHPAAGRVAGIRSVCWPRPAPT
jgi:hypothetical protein